MSDGYDKGIEAAESVLSTLEPVEDEPSNVRASDCIKLDLKVLSLSLLAQIAELDRVAAMDMSLEGHNSCLSEIEVITEEIQGRYRALMNELKAVEPDASMDEHNQFIVLNLPKLKTIRVQLLSKKPSTQPQRPVAAMNAGAANGVAVAAAPVTQGGGMKAAKLAAISAPKFSGKAQDYAEFKTKYTPNSIFDVYRAIMSILLCLSAFGT